MLSRKSRPRSGYLPSLDGWRGIAILSVIVVHDAPYVVRGFSFRQLQNYGSLGVVLFFAISGILIPWRIMEEEGITGRFHLRFFYIRRLFRIQPAALAYLVLIALLSFAGVLRIGWDHWFGALFMYENYLYRDNVSNWTYGYFTGHFWTLAVEEHFYLLVSMALFYVRRNRLKIFVLALVAIKVVQFLLQHHMPDPLLRRTYWQIHILLWPTTATIAVRIPPVRRWAEHWLQPEWILLGTGLVGAVAYRYNPNLLLTVLEYAFTVWVISTMLHAESWPTRILELPPLRFLGRISYSLYLWHVLFFTELGPPFVDSGLLGFLSQKPYRYLCSFGMATLSYYFLEKPFIRLGHRLAPPATAGHADLLSEPELPATQGAMSSS